MTKFLNISTDNTLGGNSPSDEIVSSQKAIKDYVDAHGGGGSVAIDDSTITKNGSDQLQAVATVNANTAAGATNPIYDWVGTLAEYNNGVQMYAWSAGVLHYYTKTPNPTTDDIAYLTPIVSDTIAAVGTDTITVGVGWVLSRDSTNDTFWSIGFAHPDWVCYITDDLTSGAYDAYSKSQTDALLATKASTGHEVIEFQAPTSANNYTWYRKYADGWVEQGGCVPTVNDGVWTITLPVAMADAHYTSVITREYTNYSGTGTDIAYDAVWAKTSTNFKCWEKWTGSIALNWQVSGMAA